MKISKSTRRVLILLGITSIAAVGYTYYNMKKKQKLTENNESVNTNEEVNTEPDTNVVDVKNVNDIFKLEKPEVSEEDKVNYAKIIHDEYEKEDEEDEEEEDIDYDEIDETIALNNEMEEYKKKNGNKIIILPEDDIEYTWNQDIGNDPNYPEIEYEEEELYYFVEDEVLTDDNGNVIDEELYIGSKPRQFGWFSNGKDDIYVRNNPMEKDFRVNKIRSSSDEYWN